MKRLIVSFMLVLGVVGITAAQNRIIQGIVHAFDSIPLEGVKIEVKSTGLVYETNVGGEFVVECDSRDRLLIRANGFYEQNFKVRNGVKFLAINLKMKPASGPLIHSVGYQQVRSEENTSAVSGISYKDTDFTRYTSVQDLIADNFAGVQYSGSGLIIRGSRTLQGSTEPLVVIDGVISSNGFSYLHPLDVERIDVLKDGTSAVYGSRGANGVILIETKKGGEK